MTTDRLAGTVLTAFAILVLWESRALPFGSIREPGAGAVPVLLALILLICSVAVIVGGPNLYRLSALEWPDRKSVV